MEDVDTQMVFRNTVRLFSALQVKSNISNEKWRKGEIIILLTSVPFPFHSKNK